MSRRGDSGFLFLGGHIAVDFANTVMFDGGAPVDRVSCPEDLTAWLRACELGESFGPDVTVDDATHAKALAVRGAMRSAFTATAAGEPVPDAALDALNDALREPPGTELRRGTGGGLIQVPAPSTWASAASLPWLVASAAADLLTGETATRLRRCANHDTCVLMFVDTSRSRTRRWCSMDLCGNRTKVAAHSARARAGRSAIPSQ